MMFKVSRARIESGKSCQTLGATAPKALAPVAVLVRRSQVTHSDNIHLDSCIQRHMHSSAHISVHTLYLFTQGTCWHTPQYDSRKTTCTFDEVFTIGLADFREWESR